MSQAVIMIYKIVLLRKDKLNIIEVLICKALLDLYINHDEFVSVNNVLREYNEMKEEITLCNIYKTFCVIYYI